ncbi:penicillin-binding protein PBP2X [Streptococcus fryi]
MKKFISRCIAFAVSDRRLPKSNRERVGQNLMLLTISIFFVFMINFAIIIGTDSKFGEDLSQLASEVYQRKITVQAKRGTIYDRNGNVIAEDSTTYGVFAIISKDNVSEAGDIMYVEPSKYNTVADIFNEYLGMDKDYVIEKLSQDGLVQTEFGAKGSNISYATMKDISKAISDNDIKGIDFNKSPGRHYPNGVFASDFIGYTTLKENEDTSKSLVGQTGMELYLNSLLSGTDGEMVYQKDRKGVALLGTGTTVKEAKDGKDVYTTLSAPIQSHLEAQMDIFQESVLSRQASAVLMNAKTGEILALTQRPTFNADTKEGIHKDYLWNSQFFQTAFEPGSTMKVMTLAAALDNGTFNPEETFFNNQLNVADVVIKDWKVNQGLSDGEYMNMAQAFAFSSNIGMTMLEKEMTDKVWLTYLLQYRFGLPTRFGMGGEVGGNLPEDNEVTMAMSAFGQGINVTQAQMMRAFSAISNNGEMLEPQFISKIEDSQTGATRVALKEVVGHPVSKKAAKKTRDYMVTVGTDPYYGTLYTSETGPIVQVGGYNVAVKSGTAQIAEKNGYLTGENDYLHSVVAMVPAEDPMFVMYVTFRQPEKKFNGIDWQKIFNPVLTEAMLLQDLLLSSAYTSTDQELPYAFPDIVGDVPGPVAERLRQNLLHPIILGTGSEVTKVSVKKGQNVSSGKQVLLLTDHFTAVPDMYGWTKESIKAFAKWTGITITYKGKTKGTVVDQSVKIGTKLKGVKELTVTLE